MPLCLDASAAIAAILPRPERSRVKQIILDALSRGERLVAPPLLYAETTSVLRRHVHIGAIQHQEAVDALRGLLAMPIFVVDGPKVYLRALELARRLGQPRAYDVQYLAVAQLEGCTVLTLDRGLGHGAQTLGIDARLLR